MIVIVGVVDVVVVACEFERRELSIVVVVVVERAAVGPNIGTRRRGLHESC